MTAYELDDLFNIRRQPVIERTARITCRVCDRPETVPLDHPAPLCRECLADVATTRQRVQHWLDAEQAQERDWLAAWDAVREPHQAWWNRIQDARAQGRSDADQKARAAHPIYAALLDAETAYVTALQALGAERARLEKALGEIDQL